MSEGVYGGRVTKLARASYKVWNDGRWHLFGDPNGGLTRCQAWQSFVTAEARGPDEPPDDSGWCVLCLASIVCENYYDGPQCSPDQPCRACRARVALEALTI